MFDIPNPPAVVIDPVVLLVDGVVPATVIFADVPVTASVPAYDNGGDWEWNEGDIDFIEQAPMEEDILREADEIVAAYAEKKTLKEEMHGGYLELLEMNPDFENGARLLLNAWFEWKEGPMTEPQMVDEARQDILAYLSSMMR